MAVNAERGESLIGLRSFALLTQDARRLADFYRQAFGFEILSVARHEGGNFERVTSVACGATVFQLRLRETLLELLQFDVPGRPYPEDRSSANLFFQHFAIVVTDIDRAYRQLCAAAGWQPISIAGPVKLPSSSGGVRAFKFRDPDGHPLELLEFPPETMPEHWKAMPAADLFLGIDHSAISVSSSETSIAFYRSLGFRVLGGMLNRGNEQAALDGCAPDVRVQVTSLALGPETPHLELLCYQRATPRSPIRIAGNDVAATRLSLGFGAIGASQCFVDPDGHRILVSQSADLAGNFAAETKMSDLSSKIDKPEQTSYDN
ncbi:VOC family protein [Rhizobium sp. 2YAF20]|uniref:VOC family protein n=1 Tax=Rhizobium sp. 2YAF20 TaxID=3233027 RepID=UPI003F990656